MIRRRKKKNPVRHEDNEDGSGRGAQRGISISSSQVRDRILYWQTAVAVSWASSVSGILIGGTNKVVVACWVGLICPDFPFSPPVDLPFFFFLSPPSFAAKCSTFRRSGERKASVCDPSPQEKKRIFCVVSPFFDHVASCYTGPVWPVTGRNR